MTFLAAMTPARARELVARFTGTPILVVGDIMLDRFILGRVTRISPEAPVPVVRFESERFRLGGAANVAHNLATLGAQVALIGVVGRDAASTRLRAELEGAGIDTRWLVEDVTRPTVEKVRIVTDRNQQVARIDYESDVEIGPESEQTVVGHIPEAARRVKALLVSDYLKGTITPAVMRALVSCKSADVPLLVDPKIPHLDRYAGATLVTPNQQEAEIATQRLIRGDDEARAAAADFRVRARCESVLVTRGEQGMWLSSGGADLAIQATAREVSDVTGAGDTVIATLALSLACGATLHEAAALANQAAGIVVGKFGPGTVTGDELCAAYADHAAR